jgi:hypothetical protein
VGIAQVAADGHVAVMAVEQSGEPEFGPHLAEARVDVEEGAERGGGEHFVVFEVAHHVQEEDRAARRFDHLPALQTGDLASAVEEQRPPSGQAEALHHTVEVMEVL